MKPIKTYRKQTSNKIISSFQVDMGRIKGLFCSFCLNQNPDQATIEHSFNHSIDVSHLATPHLASSSISPTARSSPSVSESANNNNTHEDEFSNYSRINRNPTPQSYLITSSQPLSNLLDSSISNRGTPDRSNDPASSGQVLRPSSYNQQHSNYLQEQEQFGNSQQQSPGHVAPSQPNLYDPHHQPLNLPQQQLNHRSNAASPHREALQPQQHYNENNNPNQHADNNRIAEANLAHQLAQPNDSNGPTKLSYDIISVREPLAKILAEKQQLLQAQQLQRQQLGDHEYIEVYGERGSSCFYEEIAGSVTSSATYDQIGNSSNHNYQVLINAYAVAQRQNNSNPDSNNQREPLASSSQANNEFQNSTNSRDHGGDDDENLYDVTSPRDQVDGERPSDTNHHPKPQMPGDAKHDKRDDEQMAQASQSIPVYSVINKATRRSNSILRASIENNRPPRPPPKNSLLLQQQTPILDAIDHTYNEPTTSGTAASGGSWMSQIPTTSSSYIIESDKTSDLMEQKSDNLNQRQHHRLPQPPPRFSKQSAFNANDRPLPYPDSNNVCPGKSNSLNNNNNAMSTNKNHQSRDDDIESLNNGYELLRSNLEDDQMDVGYEKIRESNRYSGGSLSSQIYQLQFLDNGGYESVQPIYSSPSNALAEPNYEAIAPATASELAAAATAKLTAAATVIEQIYNNSNK